MQIPWLHLYGLVLLSGAIAVLLLTPLAQSLARAWDIMDRPSGEKHKHHGHATPLLGGLAMTAGWLGVLGGAFLVWTFAPETTRSELFHDYADGIASVLPRLGYLAAGAVLAAALGLLDDVRGLKAHWKFFGQFLVALLAAGPGGVRISLFIAQPWVGFAITVFWFMLLMNAINFFDNMDGLAAGTAAIALALFAVAAAFQEQYFVASLSALGTGCALGFWFYNYAPASIFMGDSGSHFLGYLLALSSAGTTYFSPETSSTRLPILIPVFILLIPLFDTAAVTVIRTLNRKPFWIGDHNHISHRFVKMGLTRKRAVQLVHLLCFLTGLSALPMLWGSAATTAVIAVQQFLLLLLVTILQYAVKHADAATVVPPDRPGK